MQKLVLGICAVFFLFLFTSCEQAEKQDPTSRLKGTWIGTAETVPYPELLSLKYDSLPVMQCFYRGVNLYIPENFQMRGNSLSFVMDVQDFQGEFSGKIIGDTIKGIFQDAQGMHTCNFVRTASNSLASVGELVGYYRLGPKHALELLPYPLSEDITALSIVDFYTGKKRVAFPVGKNIFTAGNKMFSPYPPEIKLSLAGMDQNQVPGIEYQDKDTLYKAKRMPDLTRFEDFEVDNGNVELACTISYPNGGEAPYPLVIVTPGTGEVVRADAYNDYLKMLSWQGVAVLSYDKRGCGSSTGDLDTASFEDLATDLEAVLKNAQKHPDIDTQRIGLAGFDQAGFVMPIVASKYPNLAFMVSIAGSALSVEAQEYLACELRMVADGFDEPAIHEALTYGKKMFQYLRGEIDSATFQGISNAARNKPWMGKYTTSFDNKRYMERWKIIHAFDPLPYLKKMKMPIYAAYGEQDIISPPKYNFPILKKVFEENRETAHQLIVFEEANHLMMLGEKRGDFQFSEIIGYAPKFIPSVNQWMLDRLGIQEWEFPEHN